MKRIILLSFYVTVNLCNGQNDLKKTDFDESKIREYLNTNTIDQIEGIYKYIVSDGSQYRLGIVKSELLYIAYILQTNNKKWKIGDVKAYFEPTATKNIYSLRWIMGDKKTTEEAVVFMNNPAFIEFNLSGPAILLKLYPENKISPKKNQEESLLISSGSGFFLSKKGYVATNAHVVENAKSIEIFLNSDIIGLKSYNAKIALIDEINDVAILKIVDDSFIELKNIPYSIEKSAEIGEKVFTIGFPINSVMGDNFKVSNGIINANSGIKDDIRFMQISIPIQPGNSGGPVFNDSGNIVGLTTSRLNGDAIGISVENVNYAIKSTYLDNLMNMLPEIKDNNSENIKNKFENTLLNEWVKTLKYFVCRIKVSE